MSSRKLLFVTYHDENFEEGLSYAVELAKTMDNDIEVLMIYKRKVMEKLEDVMTAITFAEAGEHQTAKEMISADYQERQEGGFEKKLAVIREKCSTAGVAVDVGTAAMDVVSAIKNVLRQNTRVDMVLLSPSITNNGGITSKTLNKLVKTSSKPIVTMAKQAKIA